MNEGSIPCDDEKLIRAYFKRHFKYLIDKFKDMHTDEEIRERIFAAASNSEELFKLFYDISQNVLHSRGQGTNTDIQSKKRKLEDITDHDPTQAQSTAVYGAPRDAQGLFISEATLSVGSHKQAQARHDDLERVNALDVDAESQVLQSEEHVSCQKRMASECSIAALTQSSSAALTLYAKYLMRSVSFG